MREPRSRRCPTDLSDAEWAALEPLLPPPADTGRPWRRPRRLVVEAVFYLVRSGCAWRTLPRCFPPWSTVVARFRRWRLDGTLRRMHDRLRARLRSGEARGRPQAARAGGRVRPRPARARPRRRSARPARGAGAGRPRRAAPGEPPRLELVWADGAYAGTFARWLEAERGRRVEVPKHRNRHLRRYGLEEKPKGFQVIPRRWVVERTFAWLSRSRRLARDHGRLPETGEAMTHATMSRIMPRRIAA